jgi:NADH-quinone oxidoreductase subunit C
VSIFEVSVYIFVFFLFSEFYLRYLKKSIFLAEQLLKIYQAWLINSGTIKEFTELAKNDNFFSLAQLSDFFAVDKLGGSKNQKRFELNYLFLSLRNIWRFWLKIPLAFSTLAMSLSELYASAAWLEREVWDMFGVFFLNHKDLRRILTDYGFDGFPLRKDFPISGFKEIRYNEVKQLIDSEPLRLAQEYRTFRFVNPWA